MLQTRRKRVTTQTIVLFLLSFCLGAVVSGQTSVEKLKEFRAKYAKKLKEPTYESQPRYLLVAIGDKLDSARWIAVDGPDAVFFDSNGNGDITEAQEKFTEFKAVREPPGGRWKETRWFKIGVIGNVPLTLMIKVPSPLYRSQKMVTPSRLRQLELDNKHQWGHGGLQFIAGKPGKQNIAQARLTKAKENSQVVWIGGPVALASMSELVGMATVFDISKRVQPGTIRMKMGTYGLPADESTIVSFAAIDPSEIPKNVFPEAVVNFQSGPVKLILTRRVGSGGYLGQFAWPMKVPEKELDVTVTIKDLEKNRGVADWSGKVPIIRERGAMIEAKPFVPPSDAKTPTESSTGSKGSQDKKSIEPKPVTGGNSSDEN